MAAVVSQGTPPDILSPDVLLRIAADPEGTRQRMQALQALQQVNADAYAQAAAAIEKARRDAETVAAERAKLDSDKAAFAAKQDQDRAYLDAHLLRNGNREAELVEEAAKLDQRASLVAERERAVLVAETSIRERQAALDAAEESLRGARAMANSRIDDATAKVNQSIDNLNAAMDAIHKTIIPSLEPIERVDIRPA